MSLISATALGVNSSWAQPSALTAFHQAPPQTPSPPIAPLPLLNSRECRDIVAASRDYQARPRLQDEIIAALTVGGIGVTLGIVGHCGYRYYRMCNAEQSPPRGAAAKAKLASVHYVA
jgi:hypothetical protein